MILYLDIVIVIVRIRNGYIYLDMEEMLLHSKYIRASYLYSGVIVTGIFVYQKEFLFLLLNKNFMYYIINLLHVKIEHGHAQCGLGCSVPIIPFRKNDHIFSSLTHYWILDI